MEIQKIKIRKVGNSQGTVLPKNVLESVGLQNATEVNLVIEDNVLSILAPPPSLEDLLATVPKDVKFTEANTGHSVGDED